MVIKICQKMSIITFETGPVVVLEFAMDTNLLLLRSATPKDIWEIFDINNDPEVRT